MLTTMGCWTLRNSNSRSSLRMTRWRKPSTGTSETVLAAVMLLDTWHEEQHFLDCWETNVTFSRLIISDGLPSVLCPVPVCQKKIIVTLLNITLQCFDDRSDPLSGLQVHYRALCAALLLTVAAPLMDPCPDCAEMSCTNYRDIEIRGCCKHQHSPSSSHPSFTRSAPPRYKTWYWTILTSSVSGLSDNWKMLVQPSPAQESRDHGNDGQCIDE